MTALSVAVCILICRVVFAVFLPGFALVSYGFSDAPVEMRGGLIKLYIVDLDGVGGFRDANHSAVVEGAVQATFINMEHKLSFGVYISDWLIPDYDVDVYVNVTYELVHDWQKYRQLVENANNKIIVNTHNEILPVPDGYTKEGWIAIIADFMLNRWGTWVHTGGLPFRIVHYKNGTTEEWTEGFKTLMQHANQNITIKNLPNLPLLIERDSDSFSLIGDFSVYLSPVAENSHSLLYFAEALIDFADGFDYCLKFGRNDIDPSIIHIYSINSTSDLNIYAASAALRLSSKPDSYGVFVYSSPWKFADAFSNYISDYNCSIGMGAIPTAAAISCEAGYAAKRIVEANAAKVKDEAMVQKANEAFNAGNYKQAVIYAEKATASRQSNILPAIILATLAGVAITTTAIINHNNKKKKQQEAK